MSAGRSALIKRWTERLKPALTSSLLPELIGVSAEYLSVSSRFSRALTSSEVKLDDADEDGYGRAVSAQDVGRWQLAFCDEPLKDMADAHGTVRWAVQHTGGTNGTYGVGVPDPERLTTGSWGAGPQQWGLYIHDGVPWTVAHNNQEVDGGSREALRRGAWPPSPICFTADLKANRLTVAYEHAGWQSVIDVPDLASKRVFFALGFQTRARLIVDDDGGGAK